MFERKPYDQLLQDVLAAEVKAPGLTLMNTVAKERAQRLLDTADDIFNRLAKICVLMAGAHVADINSRDDAEDCDLMPEGTAWKMLRQAASNIEQRTDGSVKLKIYPGGVMGDDKAVQANYA